MPHLAAIVGAGVVVAGVCIAVNHALDERRRQREEDREFEAAIAASLYEFEQDRQRRQTQVDREQRAIASAVARSAESEGNEGTLRRRRRTSDFASRSTAHHDSNDLIEMTERMYLGHGHESAAPPLVDLFDAGPSSRASDPTYFSPPWTTVPSPWDANLDAVASPSHRATGIHEKPSMQADTRPSRVTSPLSDSLGRDGSGSGSQHAVTHTTGKAESDAGTDTTGVLISRPSSPLVVHDSFSSPTSATPRIISLPVSPSFSAVSFTHAREIQPASDRTASGEIDSAWSDLGEDSSEDEAESVAKGTDSEESARREEERQQRMRYLSRLDRGNTPYASLV